MRKALFLPVMRERFPQLLTDSIRHPLGAGDDYCPFKVEGFSGLS